MSDELWNVLKDVLPERSNRGRPPRDRRQMLNGIFWIVRAGTPWRDLPECFGPWQTVYHYFNKWRKDGTWDCIVAALQVRLSQVRNYV
jgi:transposase